MQLLMNCGRWMNLTLLKLLMVSRLLLWDAICVCRRYTGRSYGSSGCLWLWMVTDSGDIRMHRNGQHFLQWNAPRQIPRSWVMLHTCVFVGCFSIYFDFPFRLTEISALFGAVLACKVRRLAHGPLTKIKSPQMCLLKCALLLMCVSFNGK